MQNAKSVRPPMSPRQALPRLVHTFLPMHRQMSQTLLKKLSQVPKQNYGIKHLSENSNRRKRTKLGSLYLARKDRSVIGTKWVFKLKNPDTPTPRCKARPVTQGHTQVTGVDFHETFSTIVKATSVCAVFGVSALNNWLCTSAIPKQPILSHRSIKRCMSNRRILANQSIT